MSVRGFALTTAKGFLHHPLRDSLLEMTPHEFLHVVKVTPPPPPPPVPPHLIAVETRNILAKNQSSPHTLSTVVFIRSLFTIHACYIQLLLLRTTFVRFIKLAPR